MSDAVVLALITAGFPTITTAVTAFFQYRASVRNSAKQSIFSLMNDDKTEYLYGHMPSNYQNVLKEYDIYHSKGGDSYVTDKVNEYKAWVVSIEKEKHENSNKK